jgi:hypothetical protein
MSLFHFTHRDSKLEYGSIPAEYPQDAILDIHFGPEDAFGVGCEPRTFATRGREIRIHWNANEGVFHFDGELIDS